MYHRGQKAHEYRLKFKNMWKFMVTKQPKESLVLTEREYKNGERIKKKSYGRHKN